MPDEDADTSAEDRFRDIWLYCMLDHGVGTLPGGPCMECVRAFATSGPPDGDWNNQTRRRDVGDNNE